MRGPVCSRSRAIGVFRHVFEVVGVELQDGGRAGERFGHARAQLLLQQRQHLHPGPGPRKRRIGVARVVPGVQALNLADRQGVRAAQSQERPQQAVPGGPHPGQGAGSGAAGEPEQHLFGLVVEGVAEQDCPGAGVVGGGFQGSMAGVPGRRLRAHPGGGDVDGPDLHGRESQFPQRRRGGGGDVGGAGLQLVVHDDGANGHGVAVHVAAAGEVGGDGGEGQRVRAAAAGDQDPFRVAGPGQRVLQHFPRGADAPARAGRAGVVRWKLSAGTGAVETGLEVTAA